MQTEAKGVVSRVWLVDDNADDTTFIEAAFRRRASDVTLTAFADGDSMLQKLRDVPTRLRPQLILLDLNLPTRDGHEILAELKSDRDLQSVPVIVLTASQADRDVRKSYAAHANAHISKPYDFREYELLAESISAFWLRWAMPSTTVPGPANA